MKSGVESTRFADALLWSLETALSAEVLKEKEAARLLNMVSHESEASSYFLGFAS